MHDDRHGPGQNAGQAVDFPTVRSIFSKVDHGAYHGEHEEVHPLEALPDLGQLGEEVGVVFFLGGCAPGHVDAEHVGENSEEDMERYTTEKDHEEGHPLHVFEECA